MKIYLYSEIVLACTPPTPVGGWGYMSKMFAPTPTRQKNVTKIFFKKCF